MTTATHAHVAISNFGDKAQIEGLAAYINNSTLFHAYVSARVVVVPCRVHELGTLFAILANDPKLNWIEYTVQFDV